MLNVDKISVGLSMKYEFLCIIKYLEYLRAQQEAIVCTDYGKDSDRSIMAYTIKTNMPIKGIVESTEKLFNYMTENRMQVKIVDL